MRRGGCVKIGLRTDLQGLYLKRLSRLKGEIPTVNPFSPFVCLPLSHPSMLACPIHLWVLLPLGRLHPTAQRGPMLKQALKAV